MVDAIQIGIGIALIAAAARTGFRYLIGSIGIQ